MPINESYLGQPVRELRDLDHVPFSDLYSSNLLDFFIDEEADEFVEAENEGPLKEALAEALEGPAADFLASAAESFAEDETKQEMITIIKEELPVLMQFTDKEIKWPEIYQAFNFKDMPRLAESQYLRLFLRDKLMVLLDIDPELFKDSFYYYDALARQGEPVRRADIITIYKKARSVSEPAASMRRVKQLFDELLLERRKQL